MVKFRFAIILLSFFGILSVNAQPKRVPGVVVNYIPASTKTYIGSPSVCILPNGDYVASHDHFGPGTTEYQEALTAIYKSTDRGKSWKKISEINGQFWSNLFVHQSVLYIMGTWKHHGNLIIRRSPDGGVSWSDPADSKTGLLLKGEYHTAPMPVVIHNGFQYVTGNLTAVISFFCHVLPMTTNREVPIIIMTPIT